MVWAYNLKKGKSHPALPKKVGRQRNLYSVKNDDGSYNDDLEDWLAGVEAAAKEPYEQLLAGHIPTGQSKAAFSEFISSTFTRSLSMINAYAEYAGQTAQLFVDAHFQDRETFEAQMDRYESDVGTEMDRDKLFEFWNDKDRFCMKVRQQMGLGSMDATDDLTEIIYDREWYLLDSVDGFSSPATDP